MPTRPDSIRPFYADSTQYRSRLVDGVRDLTPDQLALSAGPDHAPIWALAAHCAGTRVFWLCGSWANPAPRRRPSRIPSNELGWEDDLDHPRSATELVMALESTGAIVERCLDTWTVDMLEVEFERRSGDIVRAHTRRSILLRLLSHDAFHSGEISQAARRERPPGHRSLGAPDGLSAIASATLARCRSSCHHEMQRGAVSASSPSSASAIGILTQVGQSVLPDGWSQAANAISPWLFVAFLVGSRMPDHWWAAAAGVATLVLAMVGYYAMTELRYGIGGGTNSLIFWGVGAIVGGPVFGIAGLSWRVGRLRERASAIGLVAAVAIAEGVYHAVVLAEPSVGAGFILAACSPHSSWAGRARSGCGATWPRCRVWRSAPPASWSSCCSTSGSPASRSPRRSRSVRRRVGAVKATAPATSAGRTSSASADSGSE